MKTNQVFSAMVGAALLSGVAFAEPAGPQGQEPGGDGPGRGRMQQRGLACAGCPMQQRGPEAMMRGGPGPGMEIGSRGFHNPQRLKEAGATEQQLKTLKTFATEQQLKQIDLKAAVEKAELTLGQLMGSEAADEAAALKAADTLSQARGEMLKHEISAKLKIQTILGAEVLKKLREMGPPEGMERPGRGPRPEGQGRPRGDKPAGERPAPRE
jgi:hypothetical protein